MKTAKNIILSIALVVLATSIIAQPSSRKERHINRQNKQLVYMHADYSNNESSRLENWMYDLSTWANSRVSRDVYEAPVIAEAYIVKSADVIYEEDLVLESWMTLPFESGLAEEALSIESWMTEPFEAADYIEVEDWMTEPFEAADYIEVEEWMTKAWI